MLLLFPFHLFSFSSLFLTRMASVSVSILLFMTAAAAASPSAEAGTSSNAAAAPAITKGPSTNEIIVYWFDIVLLCVLGLFFLAALPRMYGRFSIASERSRGFLFRSEKNDMSQFPRALSVYDLRDQFTGSTKFDAVSDQSHTLAIHNTYARSEKEWIISPSPPRSPPTHVRTLSSVLHPFLSPLSYSVSPSMTIGKVTLIGIYLLGMIIVVFIDGGNPLASPARLGYIATSQIPVAVALGTKNNVVGMLIGMGYEKLNFLHRWVGIVTFFAANLHTIGYIYKWAINNDLREELQKPYIVSGTVGLIGLQLLYLGSLGFVRRRAYTFFLMAHIIGLIIFFVGICYHEKVCIKYVLLGVVIYSVDHLMRLMKTRFATARIMNVPELGLTRVELPTVTAGWRAGQHVRIRVLSTEMGWLGWSVAHPFTIANASESASERGLVLMCKKVGGWTNCLYTAASRAGEYTSEKGIGVQRELKVVIEGPYGGPGNMVMSSYSSVLLVTGGSGVSFALSQAEEIVQDICNGKSAVRFLEVVWVTQTTDSVHPLVPAFAGLIDSVSGTPGVVLKVSVFCSRASG
ncbi:hypothetical protein EW145_g3533, partial [Phellinidium pouzarii]